MSTQYLFTFLVEGPSAQCMSMDLEAAQLAARTMAALTGDNVDDFTITDLDDPSMGGRSAASKLILRPMERVLTHG